MEQPIAWELTGAPSVVQNLGQRVLQRASTLQNRAASITLALMQGGFEMLQHTGALGESHVDYVLPALLFTALFKETTQAAIAVKKGKGTRTCSQRAVDYATATPIALASPCRPRYAAMK
jgi:hypothetical protein